MEQTRPEPEGPPTSKADLIDRIAREWEKLTKAASGLSEETLARAPKGGWSIKDHLAHVSAWEDFLSAHYLQHQPAHEAMGIPEARYSGLDFDGINAILHQRFKDQRASLVLAKVRATHQQLMEALGRMSFPEMTAPLPGDKQNRPLLGWITGNTYEHYLEHRLTIEQLAVAGKGS